MDLLENLNISSGKVIPRESLSLIKGGDPPQGLPPDCGDQTAYYCTVEWWGGGSTEGWACADSAAEATQMTEDAHPSADSVGCE